MHKRKRLLFIAIFVITLFCNSVVFGEEVEIKLNQEEWKELNEFFSNFSEVFLKPFKKGQVSNTELVRFGILHNLWNNYQLFQPYNSSYLKLDKKFVETTVEKYFGIKSITHESVGDKIYKDGYYIIPVSSGEAYLFSQVTKFIDMGNGYYVAFLNLYIASSGFGGDPHGNLKTWNKERDGDIPKLSSKMVATVKKVTSNGSSRYILIEYLRDK
ncbi:MAG: hypothetical protein GX075_00395 [Firmicutes bacterium]|nr:hypothetical protein [Bacillota bacterium]